MKPGGIEKDIHLFVDESGLVRSTKSKPPLKSTTESENLIWSFLQTATTHVQIEDYVDELDAWEDGMAGYLTENYDELKELVKNKKFPGGYKNTPI